MPAIPQFPRSTPVNITSVMRWSDAAAAFVTSEYVASPLGAIRVTAAGTYRLLASATPNPNYPTVVDEAVARFSATAKTSSPRMVTGDLADGAPPSTSGRDDEVGGSRVLEAHSFTRGVMAGRIGRTHLQPGTMAPVAARSPRGGGWALSGVRRLVLGGWRMSSPRPPRTQWSCDTATGRRKVDLQKVPLRKPSSTPRAARMGPTARRTSLSGACFFYDQPDPSRPRRACSACGAEFQPTTRRRVLCRACFKSGEGPLRPSPMAQ